MAYKNIQDQKEYSKKYYLLNKNKKKTECSLCGKIIWKPAITCRSCRTQTAETRLKISQATQGKNNPRFGIKLSKEIKEKISKANTLNIDKSVIKDLYFKNFTDKEIASEIGCSEGKIAKIRQEMNFPSLYKMNQLNFKEKENLIKYGIADDLKHLDCLRWRKNNEGHKHALAKFTICFILNEKGYHYLTEVKVQKGRIDIFDFTNKIIYEVENGLTDKIKEQKYNQLFNEEKMNEFFIFNLDELPKEEPEWYNWFKEKIV
jgi:hypothetical protein